MQGGGGRGGRGRAGQRGRRGRVVRKRGGGGGAAWTSAADLVVFRSRCCVSGGFAPRLREARKMYPRSWRFSPPSSASELPSFVNHEASEDEKTT